MASGGGVVEAALDTFALAKTLGFLAVPLYDGNGDEHVLLNGPTGNFCFAPAGNVIQPRSKAWSSDVGHFVQVAQERVHVYRWDRQEPTSTGINEVINNLYEFHRSLSSSKLPRELSVIAHIVKDFRSIRAALGRDCSGVDSLRAFLYLLACAASEGDTRGDVRPSDWGISESVMETVARIPELEWRVFVAHVRAGHTDSNLETLVPLVLRHAAGQLFQEAHYLVDVPPLQGSLFGDVPAPARLGQKTTSTGVYFTPSAIARSLVEESLRLVPNDRAEITIFDPAAGSGEFLREALRQLRVRDYRGQVRLVGWDISDAACEMTRFALSMESQAWGGRAQFTIEQVDALSRAWPGDIDLLLMNPPFLSWLDMQESQRDRVRAITREATRLRPDFASAFVLLALGSLADAGVIGTVVPASFLDGESNAGIREQVRERLSLSLVGRLGSQVLFSRARVDTALVVGGRADRGVEPLALWADNQPESFAVALRALRRLRYRNAGGDEGPNFSVYPLADAGAAALWRPRAHASVQMVYRFRELPPVGDVFEVHQGVHTGKNAAFILDKQRWNELPVEERRFFRPAVVNESVVSSRLLDVAYVFYPHAENLPDLKTEQNLRQFLPEYFKTLNQYRADLSSRLRTKDRWWQLSEARRWQHKRLPKLVSTYFGTPRSFAFDSNGDYVVVHGYGWLPKRRQFSEDLWLAYLAIFSSPRWGELLAGTSVQVGGGQWNLSKRYVASIPVPRPEDLERVDLLNTLSRIGKSLSAGLAVCEREHAEAVIEAYGA